MAQKITILLASVATAAVVVLSVLMWLSLQRSHEAQAALLQQHQQFSAGILQALESLRTAPAATTSVDGWSPLTVKLVSEAGEPVQGEANLTGTQFGGDKQDINLRRTTGPKGVMDFGMLPYGNYHLDVTATAARERHVEPLTITPGMSGERTIVCPTSPLPEVKLRFAFNPPATLQTEDLRYRVDISARSRRISDGEWVDPELRSLHLWVDESGEVLKEVSMQTPVGDQSRIAAGSVFGPLPPLKEYVYELDGVSIFVTNVEFEPPSHLSKFDEWSVEAATGYQPRYTKVTFTPHADADNVWELDFPEDVWAAVIDDFRESALARYVTIPEGWAPVSISQGQADNHGVGVGRHANIIFHNTVREEPPAMLVESAQLIGIEVGIFHAKDVAPFEAREYVFLVTADQKPVIEYVKTIDKVRFALERSSKKLDAPVLNEQIRQEVMPRIEGAPPASGGRESPDGGGR